MEIFLDLFISLSFRINEINKQYIRILFSLLIDIYQIILEHDHINMIYTRFNNDQVPFYQHSTRKFFFIFEIIINNDDKKYIPICIYPTYNTSNGKITYNYGIWIFQSLSTLSSKYAKRKIINIKQDINTLQQIFKEVIAQVNQKTIK